MVRHRRLFPPVTGHKATDRFFSIVFWLLMISFGIAIAHSLIVGSSTSLDGFGFGVLWVQYRVRSGGLLADRLKHAVIIQAVPERQDYDDWTNTCMFTFSGHEILTVRPERGRTVWVDERGHVMPLGRALSADDIATLRSLSSDRTLSISSLEEFLAIVTELKADPVAPE
ncbi:MAG: hypothetical protein ACYTAS_02175 [Planctomycetota bacterium]|jgi:hypothetical protein